MSRRIAPAELRIPDPIQRDAVRNALPPIIEQLDLVERTFREMAAGTVELPPKIGIHTRPNSFCHAMPAYLRNSDFAALKWVSGYPHNSAYGRPYISGLLIVNDPETGFPLAIMDATEITAARTAAASGICIRHWAPKDWKTAAILGCGEQGRFHAAMLRAMNPTAEIIAYDVDGSRAASLAEGAVVANSAREAVQGAEVIITAGPIVEGADPPMRAAWLQDRWLLLPIDFDFYVSTEVVRAADLFVVDDVDQFRYYGDLGYFRGWPGPNLAVGAALEQEMDGDRVLACNLGVGALDAAFAQRVLERLG